MLPIGEIIAGVLRGIGDLIGALRKSAEAVALGRLMASAGLSMLLAYGAAVASGASRVEAISTSILAAAFVVIHSTYAKRVDVVVPRFLADRVSQAFSIAAPWEVSDPAGVVPAYPRGVYVRGQSVLSVRVPSRVERIIVEKYRGALRVGLFDHRERQVREWVLDSDGVTVLPVSGGGILGQTGQSSPVKVSFSAKSWVHVLAVRTEPEPIPPLPEAQQVFLRPPADG